MKKTATATIETRYLETILEVSAQEAGLIAQRFARLVLGREDTPTGDRFLDYIGREMAECAARIAEYREEYAEARAEAGRIGGIRSAEARRAKRTKQTKQSQAPLEANEANEALLQANEAPLEAKTKQTKQTKLNIPNRTEPNHTISNQTEPDPTRAGARETSGGSGSGSVENRLPLVGSVSGGSGVPPNTPPNTPRHADADELFYAALHDRALDLAGTIATRFGRGAWARYIREIGADAVRMVADTLAHEIAAGETVGNPAAVLTSRLKALAEDGRR